MSVDELKRGFDRLASGVVPVEDPYGRLMQRKRRRWRVRTGKLAAAVAAVAVSVVAAGVALQGAGDRGGTGFHGWAVTSDWTWRLINSPTRGDLADDAAVIDEILAVERSSANENLPHTKVLFAGNVGTRTVALVARYSDTHAVLDSPSALRGTSQWLGSGNGVMSPVVTLASRFIPDESAQWTLVLAPDGCETSTNVGTYDGMRDRTWQPAPTGDWLVNDSATPPYLRVTCGGVTRQQGPLADLNRLDIDLSRTGLSPAPQGATAGPVLTGAALTAAGVLAFDQLAEAMHRTSGADVVWTGRVPGDVESGDAVLVVGDGPVRPVVLLIAGIDLQPIVALEPPRYGSGDEDPAENQSIRQWSLVSTGSAAEGDLIAVRVPRRAGARAELTDRVLATTPTTAVRVEALDRDGNVVAQADVTDGVAVLALRLSAAVSLNAVDANGVAVATTPFVEPKAGARVFNEKIINNW